MKIFVTGAAGYIGCILVPRLLQAGHSVLALDNFMYRQVTLLDCCNNPRFEIVCGDARNGDLIAKCMEQADAVIPLACLTGAPLCSRDPVVRRRSSSTARGKSSSIVRGSSRSFIRPPTAVTASAKKASSAPRNRRCGRSACTAASRRTWRRSSWTPATSSPSAWPRSSASARGCGPICWSTISCCGPCATATSSFRGRFQAQLPARPRRGRRLPVRPGELRAHQESALQRRAFGGEPLQAGVVRGDPPADPRLRVFGVGTGPGSRQARLHRLQRQDRGRRFQGLPGLQEGIAELIKAFQVLPRHPYGNV